MAPPAPSVWNRVEALLDRVEKPAQYAGGERNQVLKDPRSVAVRVALAFPDTYAIGMSHLGLRVLYGILNERPDCWAERVFCPWSDMEAAMRASSVPLATLESHTPLAAFDLVGFSLSYELSNTNLLTMLDLGGIPLHRRDRAEGDPLVLAGGDGAASPEPMADFVDLFCIGDGEEALPALVDVYAECRRGGLSRRETLLEIVSRVPGWYAPEFYRPVFHGDGTMAAMEVLDPRAPDRVAEVHVASLEDAYYPVKPVIPYADCIHDRISLEVMRGCTQGCRFCQAGMIKRSQRLRSVDTLLRLARETYANTGYDEISLVSLSTADYPRLVELSGRLHEEFKGKRVNVSIPSLRVNETLKLVPGLVEGVRRSSLTIAPEVATDRLRKVINKDIRNEHLYSGIEEAYRRGWHAVKLYFMVGLPTETDEDVRAIVEMGTACSEVGRKAGVGPKQATISVSNFVPKPHTPFQWHPMPVAEELRRRGSLVRDLARGNRRLKVRIHDVERSLLEGVLSRGDRRVGAAVLGAWRRGARFDAWDERFKPAAWDEAFREAGVDPLWVNHRERSLTEWLPWDHVKGGVRRAYHVQEKLKADRGETTGFCMVDKCNRCGIDVKECGPAIKVFKNLPSRRAPQPV
ncbi:MAG: TIGR03960 family B12-binding radical SAM protein [Planctomycetes bacterium]|nr:TIGR03960 family B12-binding radical SAM protein [Planctomycetota bacterium]